MDRKGSSISDEAAATPRSRAANAQDFLVFLKAHDPGASLQLREVEPDVIAAIEAAARTDWIPIGVNGPHVTEIVRCLGEERAREAWRRFTAQHLVRSPAIRALVDGAVRLFGISIRSVVKFLPQGFQQSYRDFGLLEIEWGEQQATVSIVEIPAAVCRFPAYAVLFHGVFLGLYDLMHTEPKLEYRAPLASGRIVATFRW